MAKLYLLRLCQIRCHTTNVGPPLCLKCVSSCHWLDRSLGQCALQNGFFNPKLTFCWKLNICCFFFFTVNNLVSRFGKETLLGRNPMNLLMSSLNMELLISSEILFVLFLSSTSDSERNRCSEAFHWDYYSMLSPILNTLWSSGYCRKQVNSCVQNFWNTLYHYMKSLSHLAPIVLKRKYLEHFLFATNNTYFQPEIWIQ